MEPWQSWTAVGVLGAGMYWYYTSQQASHRKAPKAAVPNEAPQPNRRKTDIKPRRKKDPISKVADQATSEIPDVTSGLGVSSGNEQLKKRKGNKKGPNGLAKSSAVDIRAAETSRSLPIEDEDGGNDEINTREFARQLSSKKTGTNLSGPSKQSQPPRTQKLGKAKAIFDDHLSPSSSLDPHIQSSTSSTTGADADDDLSSSNSPALGAQMSSSSQGGVADMLEAPTTGPSVLRLTDPVQPTRTTSNKQPKPVQQEETKKQRQNRKRAEQRKIELQEAEKQRRILLERQLKTAREAEGRPAKNGVPVQKAPPSKWTKPPQVDPDITSGAPLLDTLEPESSSAPASKPPTVADKEWNKNDLPSEEEQLRMLNEMDNDWQTVKKPKRKDRSAANGKAGGTTASSSSTGEEEKAGPPEVSEPEKVAEQKPRSNSKVNEKGYRDGIYVPYAETGHPEDSDWPVV